MIIINSRSANKNIREILPINDAVLFAKTATYIGMLADNHIHSNDAMIHLKDVYAFTPEKIDTFIDYHNKLSSIWYTVTESVNNVKSVTSTRNLNQKVCNADQSLTLDKIYPKASEIQHKKMQSRDV
jgi:hypothetical protein